MRWKGVIEKTALLVSISRAEYKEATHFRAQNWSCLTAITVSKM